METHQPALLLVDDSADDAVLIERALTRAGLTPDITRVSDADALQAALAAGGWDAVLCEHSVGTLAYADVLAAVREHDCDLPFILVSQTADEAEIVDAMHSGVCSFVSKRRLRRLAPVLARTTRDAAAGRRHRQDRERLAALASIVESSQDAIVARNLDGVIISWNRAAEALYGWSAEEVLGRPLPEMIPPGRDGEVELILRAVARGEKVDSFETKRRRKDGSTIDIALTASPILSRGEVVGASWTARDITAQRRDREQLRATRELFEGAFENAPVGMAMVSAQGESRGRYVRVNRVFAEMLGRRPQDVVGRTPAEVTHADDLPADAARLERLLAGETEDHTSEKRYVRPDGSATWAILTARLVRDGDGNPQYALGVAADITARVEAEREQERLERMLHQAQKLEGIGRLAGGVAHDFNNLLAVILNYAELGREPEYVEEALGEISHAAASAAELTSRLLVFSRQDAAEPEVVEVNELVDRLRNLLQRTIGEDIALRTDLDPTEPRVCCAAVQVEQAILNLAVNARDAMPAGGELRIETCSTTLTTADSHSAPGLVPGPYIEVRVTDTGTGMPPAVLERIFEPFFTTKDEGRGTGLGLPMVYGIATSAGGTVLIESEEGAGTTVRLLLPPADAEVREERASDRPAVVDGDNRRVLVVEDEEQVRRLIERILATHGYDVVSAAHPAEALDIALSDSSIELLLTDVVMPGMSGPQLASEVLEHRPELGVLFTTGYTDRPAEIPAAAAVVRKPFTVDELLTQVAAA